MRLIEALQEQMRFCEREYNYKCGIYITTEANKDIVMKVIDNMLPAIGREVEIRNSQCESFIRYPNGNMIRIVRANSGARGQRFNGVIIDSNVHQECINTIILPCLMPLKLEDGTYSRYDNPRLREYHCHISREDVIESEKYKQLVYVSSSDWRFAPTDNEVKRMLQEQKMMLFTIDKNRNGCRKGKFMMYFDENTHEVMTYDAPVVTKEVNNDKVMLYEAWGIPKDMITYETEFVNKTKQTYLNIKGEFVNEMIGFENDINVHLRVDTDVYDGYEVHVEDGLVTVVLHEIKNEAPVLKDYGAV